MSGITKREFERKYAVKLTRKKLDELSYIDNIGLTENKAKIYNEDDLKSLWNSDFVFVEDFSTAKRDIAIATKEIYNLKQEIKNLENDLIEIPKKIEALNLKLRSLDLSIDESKKRMDLYESRPLEKRRLTWYERGKKWLVFHSDDRDEEVNGRESKFFADYCRILGETHVSIIQVEKASQAIELANLYEFEVDEGIRKLVS
jgi:hypothetical protein